MNAEREISLGRRLINAGLALAVAGVSAGCGIPRVEASSGGTGLVAVATPVRGEGGQDCGVSGEAVESKTRIVFRTMVVNEEGEGLGSSRRIEEVTVPVPRGLGEGNWVVAPGGVVPTGESIMVTVDVVSPNGNRVPVASGVSGMASSVEGSTLLNIPTAGVFLAWERGDSVIMRFARNGYVTQELALTRDMVSEPEEGLGGGIAGMIEGISVVTMERD